MKTNGKGRAHKAGPFSVIGAEFEKEKMSDYLDSLLYDDALTSGGEPLRVASVRSHYYVGLDIGQKRDHTAMAIVERAQLFFEGRDPVTYAPLERVEHRLRYLKRLPLGLPYSSDDGQPSVVGWVATMMERLRAHYCGIHGKAAGDGFTLVADATGVGTPVVELLRQARLRCQLVAVTITVGAREAQTRDGWNVPKRDLVTGLQVMYERDELRMADRMKLAGTLQEELANMGSRVTETGKETYSAWREGVHDDLVLAVALAVWRARQGRKSPWGRVRLV